MMKKYSLSEVLHYLPYGFMYDVHLDNDLVFVDLDWPAMRVIFDYAGWWDRNTVLVNIIRCANDTLLIDLKRKERV